MYGSGTYSADGIKAIAQAISVMASLTSLNLSDNNLAGETGYVKATAVQGPSFNVGDRVIYQGCEMIVSKGIDSDGEIKMVNLSGVKALAHALRVNPSMTSLDISNNGIGDEGVKSICEALKNNKTLKVLDLNASKFIGGEIGPQGAKYLAEMLVVNPSLTSIDLSLNSLGSEGAKALAPSIRDSPSLTYLW